MADYSPAIRRAAKKYGIDPKVFLRQLRQESGLNPGAVSSAGASGIAQFMPATAKQYGVDLADGRVGDDLDGAARYMRDNLRRTGGDYRAALSIYNSGRPDGYKSIPETRNYVSKILDGAGADAGADAPEPVEAAPGRRDLLLSYLQQRDRPDALLQLASGLSGSRSTETRAPASKAGRTASRGTSGDVTELFYDPAGGIKHGEQIGAIGGHSDHVHFAGKTRAQTLQMARLAERLGLSVRELEEYDPVDPVHTEGSYHYQKSGAGDASGDPEQMERFYRAILRRYGVG